MAELTLVVGNKNYSSWSLRPWLALKHTGLAFSEEVIPLYEPGTKERLARLSPSGKVPVLRHGDIVVWDSLAICEYLAETFPSAGLWPRSADGRAMTRSICCEMHSGFVPLRTHMPMNLRKKLPGKGHDAPEVQASIDRIVSIWEQCRREFGKTGPFLFGEFSIADAFYAPVATRFDTYEVPLAEAAAEYRDTILALPSLQEWIAEAEKETRTIAEMEK